VELERDTERTRPVDAVAGLMSAAALFASLIAIVYRPVRIAPFAAVVALIAIAMSKRSEKLGQLALGVAGASFVAGMIVAVVVNHPLF
jgi:hypothetical protein